MPRSIIVGSGKAIPPICVTNDMLARVMDTTDAWIQERSGVKTRYYVEKGTSSADLGALAAAEALANGSVDKDEVDLLISATMTPDHFFPGNGGLLQKRLGMKPLTTFDIRQQCAGFLYAMQLADVHVRSGLAKTVLIVGHEVHTGFMPYSDNSWACMYGQSEKVTPEEFEWNSRFRHLIPLFGDGAAAVVVRATDDEGRGVVDQLLRTDGTDYDKLYVPGTGFSHRPYTDPEQFKRGDHVPVMEGRHVFKLATTRMIEASQQVLTRNGVKPEDVKLVLMHQANMRINEYCAKQLGLREDQVPHNIERYGNTTAATIPLLWDEAARAGRIEKGDQILMVAFGAGMNWGATLLRA
ncbi:MAG: 3-oxoacyl-ACP synthase [Vicinamibacteria bacterium]|jgi:3-oxoacyl-[acyl-carrier-protein] synthase-3|nr:3-oxoacyl-ACP synthase [Vicinamibacteria bacterium]